MAKYLKRKQLLSFVFVLALLKNGLKAIDDFQLKDNGQKLWIYFSLEKGSFDGGIPLTITGKAIETEKGSGANNTIEINEVIELEGDAGTVIVYEPSSSTLESCDISVSVSALGEIISGDFTLKDF